MLADSLNVGYLATAGVMVNDLGGDGAVHVGEEHLGVAVRGHTAVHHHQGALHGLSPPGVVLLQDSERGYGYRDGKMPHWEKCLRTAPEAVLVEREMQEEQGNELCEDGERVRFSV